MAENKMLIDATHPEETRVVVLRNGRVEEFDYESAARKLLRGSIFLAKITRVEPSLQAAFVDYGGNRHGFLAFNEIHPDYYQIPHADRQALLAAEGASRAGLDEHSSNESDDDWHDGSDPDSGSDSEPLRVRDGSTRQSTSFESEETFPRSSARPFPDHRKIDIEDLAVDVRDALPPETIEDPTAMFQEGGTGDDASRIPNDGQDPDLSDTNPPQNALEDRSVADTSPPTERLPDGPNPGPSTLVVADSPDAHVTGEVIVGNTAAHVVTTHLDTSSNANRVSNLANFVEGPTVDLEVEGKSADESSSMAVRSGAGSLSEPSGALDEDHSAVEESVAKQERAHPAPTEEAMTEQLDAEHADREQDEIDEMGSTDALEEVPVRRRRSVRSYKIQEVIKRRQIVLVQVVKEERGNKGAALTTYLSLAGRYTVLMPNTARGGGISRKITNIQDRKRLKAIAQELDVPEGMGLIIRTAGAARTKQEIKRDFEYLLRLWENVRDLTLQSTAPTLVYEEGDLIKRSIRDLYSKDVEQVLVAGEGAHKEAKSFMRMLMPSHAKNVIRYDDSQPLFSTYRIEQQLNAMFSPFVQLRSGGYLVINQTEALVAVDVNSGKSTRKFSIEETALNTNLEAAEELSRQLKLRDLAGLIVIDFIDMEEKRNNRSVERRLKECLRDDRARIQVGRISHFGLLEMSRQRLRTGVLEGSTMPCHHCQGTGIIRSTESVSLAILRSLEDSLMTGASSGLIAYCSREAAMFLLNQKRHFIQDMEARYSVSIQVQTSDEQQGADFVIDRQGDNNVPVRRISRHEATGAGVQSTTMQDDVEASQPASSREDTEERKPRRRRRRRPTRRGADEVVLDSENSGNESTFDIEDPDQSPEVQTEEVSASDDVETDERNARRRRRGRRGGRRNRTDRVKSDDVATPGAPQPVVGETDATWQAKATTDNAARSEPLAPNGTEMSDSAPGNNGHDSASGSYQLENIAEDRGPYNDRSFPPPTVEVDSGFGEHDVAALHAVNEMNSTAEIVSPVLGGEIETSAAVAERSAQQTGPTNHTIEAISNEPVLERIVMRPTNQGASTDVGDDDANDGESVTPSPTTRKGWWQRRFGARS
ncbi:MAG: Rne/Rng family ribonuclease [Hyphomicrobiaceae bacterium]